MGQVPGMNAKLSETWAGPFEVVARLNAVNYKVKSLTGKSKLMVRSVCAWTIGSSTQ